MKVSAANSSGDTMRGLPVEVACEALGISRSAYYAWRKVGLLDPFSPGEVSRLEAEALAVIALLCSQLGSSEGRMAFRQIYPDVVNQQGGRYGEIVWIRDQRRALVVRGDSELAAAVRSGWPARVIDPIVEIQRILDIWDAEVADRRSNRAVKSYAKRLARSEPA